MIRFGSVCSGIEAASAAWHSLGWASAWLAEIEPFPSAVLAHHFPETENHGDMTHLPVKVLSGEIAAPEVLVGGTPCQSFSIAGLREGLDDPRGLLTMKYVELLNAIDHVRATRNEPPAIAVWENVPGVLSDKDNAFGCFLGALAGEDSELQPAGKKWGNAGCVYGPKRAIAWRVLDAQYFGLAQRRNRVFLVASARDGFDPAKILFEFDSVRRDSAPSRAPGESTSHEIAPGLTASGRGVSRIGDTRGQDPIISMDRAHALGRNNGQENAVLSFAQNSRDEVRLVGGDGQISVDRNAVVITCATKQQAMTTEENMASTLAANDYKEPQAVVVKTAVRRLTPIECERLQGFPDNYTKIPWRGKPAEDCPDGHRYKALGNSMAVNVMRWIGERIAAVTAGGAPC